MAEPRSAASATAGLWPQALGAAARRRIASEWRALPLYLASLERPRASGWAAGPRDARPPDPAMADAVLGGVFALGGETLTVPAAGDPWSLASPSRRFALALHRFDWLPALMAAGAAGAAEALRLTLAWEPAFGRGNGFAWGPEVIERRVFNLACAGRALTLSAPAADKARLAQSLARQARHLAGLAQRPPRAADQLAAAAVAGAALAGQAGDRLLARVMPRLDRALALAVRPDGGHASRSPQAGLELLFDLLALEDGLGQRGVATPHAILQAITRLTAALRFFTFSDGCLAALQGGETSERGRVAAGLLHAGPSPDTAAAGPEATVGGYERLSTPGIEIIADAAAPAEGPWSLAACGQPLAIEVACGRDRLITSSAWSPEAVGPQALRLAPAASTAVIGLGSVGAPLSGFPARALGPRLVGGVKTVVASRRETEAGIWLDIAHDGWVKATGLTHERRLFLDRASHELRGEDRFAPAPGARPASTPIAIYFHLHPEVTARLARDQRSVLLRGPSEIGWWLRNDAGEVAVDASVHLEEGRPRRTATVVMRGRLRADRGGRIRWKLALAEPGAAPTAGGLPSG